VRGLKIDFVLQHTYMYYNYKVRLSTLYGLVHIFILFFYPPGFFHNLTCVSLLFHHLDTLFQPPTYTVDQGKVHLPISIFAEKVPSQYYSEAIHKKKRVKQLCQSKHKRNESSRYQQLGPCVVEI
jgi:hypothetical protein